MTLASKIARVWVDIPLPGPFDYLIGDRVAAELAQKNSADQKSDFIGKSSQNLVGKLVRIPWAKQFKLGVIAEILEHSDYDPNKLKALDALHLPELSLNTSWMEFVAFAARYYHRPPGEIALPALPKAMRVVLPPAIEAAKTRKTTPLFQRLEKKRPTSVATKPKTTTASASIDMVTLSDQQARALEAIKAHNTSAPNQCFVLHGVTGSGKTEVYLQATAHALASGAGQVLLMVPEIGLTPQFMQRVAERFPDEIIAMLHSGMADGERAAHWLAAVQGQARILVGTRLAVFTPIKNLSLIVIDEEHDPSYKQAEGVHYSARDMAIALASRQNCPIILGSATPSLETWQAIERGRYKILRLDQRVYQAAKIESNPEGVPYAAPLLPQVHLINVRGQTLKAGLSLQAQQAIQKRLALGEQSLVFLNRRGFAPVIHCSACSWVSECSHCSACQVLHKQVASKPNHAVAKIAYALPTANTRRNTPYYLMCHHCASSRPVPRFCPDCGNADLQPIGQGTQRLEEDLQHLFPQARIGRLDRDVARKKGATEAMLASVHAGETDILLGTQMLAKGHHFEKLTLVVVINADSGLYAADFRAPERLFANLMQVAGRAGRTGLSSDVIIQTEAPEHPAFQALRKHDYVGFAQQQIAERQQAQLPPFSFQALLRAQAREQSKLMEFLQAAAEHANRFIAGNESLQSVTVYDPVPMPMQRIADLERAQLLIESTSRKALHQLLDTWLAELHATRSQVQWQLDVDPQEI